MHIQPASQKLFRPKRGIFIHSNYISKQELETTEY